MPFSVFYLSFPDAGAGEKVSTTPLVRLSHKVRVPWTWKLSSHLYLPARTRYKMQKDDNLSQMPS